MKRRGLVALDSRHGMRTAAFAVALFVALVCLIGFLASLIALPFASPKTHNPFAASDDDLNDESVDPVTRNSKFSGRESPALCAGKIQFPQQTLNGKCEGHFATSANVSVEEGAPFPSRHRFPFCGMLEWSRQLKSIERVAAHDESQDVPRSGIRVQRQRGLSTSRFTGRFLGNKEYADFFARQESSRKRGVDSIDNERWWSLDHRTGSEIEREYAKRVSALDIPDVVCWTGDLNDEYISSFNVVPSREFYHYVLMKYNELQRTGRYN